MKNFRDSCVALATMIMLASCQTTEKMSFTSITNNTSTGNFWNIDGYLYKPKGQGPHPVVVLLHHCGGVGRQVTQDWPDFLTGLGYAAFTINSMGSRSREASNCREMGGYNQVTTMLGMDAYGALDYLATLPDIDIKRAAAIGFSLGATNINRVIASGSLKSPDGRQFKAAVAYYGECNSLYSRSAEAVPLLEIVAELDFKYGGSCVDKGEMDGVEVVVINGAYHAFDQYRTRVMTDAGGTKMVFDRRKRDEARQITKAFLAKNLGN